MPLTATATPETAPDTALLAAWADEGDERAFAALVERHVNLVHGVALRRLAEDDAARDVTQTVFAIMARKAHALKNVRILAAWLHRVTSAQSARAIRQMVRERQLKVSVMQHASLTTGGRDPLADALPLLDNALDNLPERDRSLLMLRYSEGVSFAEASVRTGRSEAALRQQTMRAVDRLATALKRKGVNVPSVTLTAGLAGVLSGGSGKTAGAEIARKALLAAPAVPAVSLFFTTVLTMTAFHTTVLTGVAALLLTGVPAIWQGLTLTHLRNGAGPSFVQATGDSPSVQSSGTVPKKPGNTWPAASSRAAAPLDPIAFEEAASAAMEGLFMETADRMAGIETRRVALALGLNPEAEAALRQRLSEVFVSDAKGNDHEEIPGHEKTETPKENLAQRVRRTITEYLTATAPEKVDLWRTQLRQREETEIEKIASDAFHATASYVDLTPDQKNALFEKCSAGARELYATPWSNSAQMGVNIRPQQTERLEEDPAILQEVLTPAQLNDWQTLSASQHEFYDSMPRRITGRLFSFASGPQLAAFLRSTLQDDSNSSSGPEPPLIILDKEVEPAPK
ncbi:MAG TPA: sigma-70 family RNA polymerase sigma factor [Verrucomicrobiales bacterium]|nr:sigma-70 family RNA polymerase sigma factor [Verrucomicrobiales bacterium]